ncbi:MAG: Gas vesicle synthesis protein GvpO [Methanosaeta sp. PtaB.Bin018]|jgi:hypothetical protein|nr:hypothetical protein [Methanothrix sp.]OPX75947.1 MAG: Gas vesicle synthesis protein GvpO [Methanosaeta sp. PtaB.Bin018]OPY43681.1 MAG: Gas vesicle synthesis protein GvpO [Methanosaeta sp. PtaU1.Bin016]HOV51853.1 gas vesicle protein GvpO [Methanothrix sp.]
MADTTDKPGIQRIYEKASMTAEALLKKKLDAIVSLNREPDGWLAEVELVERKSIPDTQDILGRYEMMFDLDGELLSYKRIMLRRRSDMETVAEEV